MQRLLNTVLRRETPEPATPLCPEHGVEMRLRGKMGRPARFEDQTQETYTVIYFCPVHGEPQPRPDYIRRRERL